MHTLTFYILVYELNKSTRRRIEMPCNCDHLEPSQHERESKKLMKLMAGVGLCKDNIPLYGKVSAIHEHTAMLCKFCENNDVTQYSLELQVWWRDHQEADKAKLKAQMDTTKSDKERKAALKKLTAKERSLLGL